MRGDSENCVPLCSTNPSLVSVRSTRRAVARERSTVRAACDNVIVGRVLSKALSTATPCPRSISFRISSPTLAGVGPVPWLSDWTNLECADLAALQPAGPGPRVGTGQLSRWPKVSWVSGCLSAWLTTSVLTTRPPGRANLQRCRVSALQRDCVPTFHPTFRFKTLVGVLNPNWWPSGVL